MSFFNPRTMRYGGRSVKENPAVCYHYHLILDVFLRVVRSIWILVAGFIATETLAAGTAI